MIELPVSSVIPEVRTALETHGTCILEAPPGAGKTTVVPLALHGRIVMLEPRRLAARSAARRMASLLGESIGQTVGYRMRMETNVGPETRIEVVTEGVLTRRLAHDATLEGTDLIIFDEFHERSIHADMGLGLCLLTRTIARPDLKILVMSATLSSLPQLSGFLGDAPVVRSVGRMFPVDVTWAQRSTSDPVSQQMSGAIRDALRAYEGDALCFLPGATDIRRTLDVIERSPLAANVDVMPLYGDLSGEAQDRAIAPSIPGRRKVVLSTSIAETSITIDGVRIVIDSGLAREPRFDPRSGMQHLVTVPVSKDGAEQRAGRAGRTASGVCVRLWTRAEHDRLPERRTPEILAADLVPLVLDLAAYGASPSDVPWIDAPPAAPLAHAIDLLRELGALDANGIITPHGTRMARAGAHPRLAHMLVAASDHDVDASTAAAIAALLGERDILRNTRDADLVRRLHVLSGMPDDAADRRAVTAARQRWEHLRHRRGAATVHMADAARCVALAYPDRVAKHRDGGRYLMRNGRTARLLDHDPLVGTPWLAIAEIDVGNDATIQLAAAISDEHILSLFGHDLITREELVDDATTDLVTVRQRTYLGAIIVGDREVLTPDASVIAHALFDRLLRNDLRDLPWTDAARTFMHRARFADVDVSVTRERLAPLLIGMRRVRDVARLDMTSVLRSWCTHQELRTIDRVAPTHLTLPSGRHAAIDYTDPERPVVSSKLQDFFGMHDTPRIGTQRIPLTVELLSPAGRPVQVTQDLAGFWKGSYAEVRKELRGRYPKHRWPEDPS